MFKKLLFIAITLMIALTAFVSPVKADKPEGEPPFGWDLIVTPTEACFPSGGGVPAFVHFDITIKMPPGFDNKTALLTVDPALFNGIGDNPYEWEIIGSQTKELGELLYYDGPGTQTKTYTWTLIAKGKTITETVTIKFGSCPVIGEPPELKAP